MPDSSTPLVVQYLYVHEEGERFYYPNTRVGNSATKLAARYLECALVQAASLALRETSCELALATNVKDPASLGRHGARLLGAIESLGVRVLHAPYEHGPSDRRATYLSSRYVLDAILVASSGEPDDRPLVLTDLDCVWVQPEMLFDLIPKAPEIGAIHIEYPPDWGVVGFADAGQTRIAIGQLAQEIGGNPGTPLWIGGELLAGSASAVRDLVAGCAEIDRLLAERGQVLPTEEQVFSLAGAAGRVPFRDLFDVARRIQTGARHEAPLVADPCSLALWHLPSEKGLSLRRTASEILRGRTGPLRRDLTDPARLARRFNVAGTGVARRLRDDGWIAASRLLGALRDRAELARAGR